MPNIEPYLSHLIAAVLPYATTGVLVAALVVAVSRLPLLNIAAMTAACACLGAILSTGEGGMEVGMQMTVAGGVAGGILLLSGGPLWRRPSLRRLLRRGDAQESAPHTTGTPSPQPSPLQGEGAEHLPPATSPVPVPPGEPAPPYRALGGRRAEPASSSPGLGGRGAGLAESVPFRLAAAAVVALAAEALAPVVPLPVGASDLPLALWLVGMGLFAAFSSGSVIVSATGYVMALSAAMLFVPALVSDITVQPMTYAALTALMIVAALGFSFAATWRKPAERV